jgi:hypothetical protein
LIVAFVAVPNTPTNAPAAATGLIATNANAEPVAPMSFAHCLLFD